MKPSTDQLLIEKILQGDTRAYGILVERYQNYIFTLVFRMLKVREEAEEVAQDTFLKAYEALSTFRGESKFSTWLYRIAYRKALDRIRQTSRATTTELIEEITGDAWKILRPGLIFYCRKNAQRSLGNVSYSYPNRKLQLLLSIILKSNQ